MSDLIRRAVELADGWSMVGDVIFYPGSAIHGKGCSIYNTHTIYLDSLAAQLVRQVDALPFPVMVIASKDSVSVVEPDETYLLPNPQQGGRTLNTIKAIVESKVLETDDE